MAGLVKFRTFSDLSIQRKRQSVIAELPAAADRPDTPAGSELRLSATLPLEMSINPAVSARFPTSNQTPGEMDASLACVSNTDRPRSVTNAKKNAILATYGYPASTEKSSGEFDHWFLHWMGGSDTAKNIWFEPHTGKFGSVAKDKVELLLRRKVCVNKTMSLDQAKAINLNGWTKLLP